jgi:hypothetical protein
LLAALGMAVVVAAASYFWPVKSAAPAAPSSNRRPQARAKATPDTVKPADLDVHLEDLKQSRSEAQASNRNPFKFYVPPPPPPPPVEHSGRGPEAVPPPVVPIGPPPIALKFIGTLETRGGKIAVFSDCRTTMNGKEGDIIDGRYRLVKIGVESVVMEYADGRGRTTIRETGQECVGK